MKKYSKVPKNALVLHPDGKWRNAEGKLIKDETDGDAPSFILNADGSFTKIDSKSKSKKKTKKHRIDINQKSLPANLASILGERELAYPSEDIARTIQEATGREIENRLKVVRKILADNGIDSFVKFAFNKDMTIDSEIQVDLDDESISNVLNIIGKNLKIPPGTYANSGWRWEQMSDKLTGSFPLVDTKTGEVVMHKGKHSLYQLETGYSNKSRRIKGMWNLSEKVLGNIHKKGGKQKPREFFVRIHWNPFNKVPTRQE